MSFRRKRTRLKTEYSTTELAKLAGVCRETMRQRLKSRGVDTSKRGRVKYPLSLLRAALYDLWQSLDIVDSFDD